jgi:hypothetical protein
MAHVYEGSNHAVRSSSEFRHTLEFVDLPEWALLAPVRDDAERLA